MKFTLHSSNCLGVPSNCNYSIEIIVTDTASLSQAVSHDYVGATYSGDYRSKDNFLKSDCLAMDVDNDHTDNPDEWVNPSDVAETFPDVAFAVHCSRNNMKSKNGEAPRPRFHVLFPIEEIADADAYSAMKQRAIDVFPFFDSNALDAARFFIGTNPPEVELFDGSLMLDAFLADADTYADFDADIDDDAGTIIPQGSRNSTMSLYAGKILIRYGDTDKAYDQFLSRAADCDPPLEEHELDTIWQSAKRFYADVSSKEGYIPPDQYNQGLLLKPNDYSDVGQATVLAREYKEILRFSRATSFLVYNGSKWEESDVKAQGIAQELTTRQLKEAQTEITKNVKTMVQNGTWTMIAANGRKSDSIGLDSKQAEVFQNYKDAMTYQAYVIKSRDSRRILASLTEAKPLVEIDPHQLDANEFLLNTPSATYDLREGTSMPHPHDPQDFITKQTAVDPDETGMDLWQKALDTFFPDDPDLQGYVQEVAGLAAIGKVHHEALIIAYGNGKNGKSTFFNPIARVLGDYSGCISADALTVGCRRNIKPELAEARGKRLLIASELEEGTRLSTSNVKQLCSTDVIRGEKKYKDPLDFVPTHMLVLYTNHLPKVSALDEGTWRRLVIVPFNATIDKKTDIKNYGDYLFEHCGGAILTWVIEGAKRVIENDFDIKRPQVVEEAIQKYREANDWLSHFLEDCCEVGGSYSAKSGEFYENYRSYCMRMGEYTRGTTDFYTALEQAGFDKKRSKAGNFIKGIQLKSDFLEDPSDNPPDDDPGDDFDDFLE